eukprot:6496285-Alexandrium_andersonii.AAC.1
MRRAPQVQLRAAKAAGARSPPREPQPLWSGCAQRLPAGRGCLAPHKLRRSSAHIDILVYTLAEAGLSHVA